MTTDTTNKNKSQFQFILPIIAVLLVVGLWMFCYYYLTNKVFEKIDSTTWAMRGQFGDMFGAVNALFSGLAFSGIIYTILMQREELSLQREELKLNRQELQDTRKEFEQQNETLWMQRFESTFFNLLTTHNKLVDGLKILGWQNEGRTIFTKFVEFLQIRMREFDFPNETISESEIEPFERAFHSTFKGYHNAINLYIRSLCSLLKYTSKSDLILKSERPQYLEIIFNQLSQDEKTFLFYYLSSANHEALLGDAVLDFYGVLEEEESALSMIAPVLIESSHSKLRDLWKRYSMEGL
jgi:hypothetical protein